jgi:hypothetical protein
MNYQHMKGPGDLPYPGDPQDAIEPVFDSHDAAAAVAADLWRNGDIPEILEDLADQFVLLSRLSKTWPELGHILSHSARLSRLIGKKLESLNEEG